MKHKTRNAFNSTNQFAPLRVSVSEGDLGCIVHLSPMNAKDAFGLWPQMGDSDGETLLFDFCRLAPADGDRTLTLAGAAWRTGVKAVAVICEDCIVLDDEGVSLLTESIEVSHLRAVRVDGPIEQRDADAIRTFADSGRSGLNADFRATASMELTDDSAVTIHLRHPEQALAMAAENFRHYLAALLQEPAEEIDPPHAHQLERVLSLSGELLVRPIETTIFSGMVDVGISTDSQEAGPAGYSLIYDRPSNSWHDEP